MARPGAAAPAPDPADSSRRKSNVANPFTVSTDGSKLIWFSVHFENNTVSLRLFASFVLFGTFSTLQVCNFWFFLKRFLKTRQIKLNVIPKTVACAWRMKPLVFFEWFSGPRADRSTGTCQEYGAIFAVSGPENEIQHFLIAAQGCNAAKNQNNSGTVGWRWKLFMPRWSLWSSVISTDLSSVFSTCHPLNLKKKII